MAYCSKGHWYDQNSNTACPVCPQLGGGGPVASAPPTQFEEGGALPPVQPFPGLGAMRSGGAAGAAPRPVSPAPPAAAGSKTVFEEATEASERLMGFLVILSTKQDEEYRYFRLRKGVNFIGRFGSRCSVELRDSEASQQHALIVCTNNANRLIDLDSSNGTRVNGDRIEIAILQEGDRIAVGRTQLLFVPFDFVAED